MVSKNKTNLIRSLRKKKARDDEKAFVIEGDKIVKEFLLANVPLKILIAKPEFISALPSELKQRIEVIESVGYEELKQLSSMTTPHNAMAIVPIFSYRFKTDNLLKGFTVALDFVQDPGNLGTIIRGAAWFGIKDIICSADCVDVYNPKVIQATMGAILNVRVHYLDLKELLKKASETGIPVFGTLLEGESIYNHPPVKSGIILLGNESQGISEELKPFITQKLMIPRFTKAVHGIESLNVGMAASVIFSEFLRKSACMPE